MNIEPSPSINSEQVMIKCLNCSTHIIPIIVQEYMLCIWCQSKYNIFDLVGIDLLEKMKWIKIKKKVS